MKMCYHAYDLSFTCNSIIFLLAVVLFSGIGISESLLLPLKDEDMKEAILLGAEIGDQPLRKSIQKRDHSSISNPAWFGPRLGRKKRSIPLYRDDIFENTHEIDLDYYFELMKNYPQFALLLSDGSGKDAFSKLRYGRANTWSEDDERIIQKKTPPFSPRLGRRSPIPLKPRLGRGGNSPENAVFRPRLGRDPNFHHFTEFSDSRNDVDDKDH